jgi:LysM repeat protein
VYENQGVPFVFVKKGDTWYSIAKEFGIFGFQLYKQNDLQENDILIPGQMLYLEPKKRKNPERTYIVKQGESMYSISQEKCVRLHQLIKFNKLKPGDEPQPGTEIKLAR